jgi:DNA-binding NtrC family response regulator
VRLIAATNKNLEELVRQGTFREDLFFRLRVLEIWIPPLRERWADIPLLAQAFLKEFAEENQKTVTGFTQDAMDLLTRYSWPGNVRELRAAIEHAVVLCRGDRVTIRDLPPGVRNATEGQSRPAPPQGEMTMKEAEKDLIIRTLKEAKSNRVLAARKLGISRRTLYRKLALYSLEDF